MKAFLNMIYKISRSINDIAGVCLIFLMLLTVADVILRLFKRPIMGTYELVSLAGACVFGLAFPFASYTRQHIYVDSFIQKAPGMARNIINVITRCMGMFLFIWIGWNLITYGMDLRNVGEVSTALHLPFYFVAYGIGICCLFECLVLFCDIIKIFGGQYE